MKNLSFLKVCAGLSMMIVATALLIFATKFNPVQADSPATTNATGKIMMSESGFVHNGTALYHVLVWDTETGRSKLYNFNANGAKMAKSPYQIPSSPLY